MRDSGEALTLLSDDRLIGEDQFLLTPWKQNRETYSVGWAVVIGLAFCRMPGIETATFDVPFTKVSPLRVQLEWMCK